MFVAKKASVHPLVSILALGLWVAGLGGCSPARRSDAVTSPGKRYQVHGTVLATDASRGEVTLDGEAIPGFMEAMTMPYKLKDPSILKELHTGDEITAVLLVNDIDDRLDQIVVTRQAQPDYKPAVFYHALEKGEAVPDFRLLNQSGQHIHLAQFRGKVLLVTFIYTRCPLADFCPRMGRNFALLDKALAADPKLYARSHLLSVSFDPGYDTPAVLRSYGGAYTGRFTREDFAHWDFASPSKADLPEVTKFFVVGVVPEQDKTLTHSLSTVVVDPAGRIYSWYPTNEWTPDQLLQDVKDILAQEKTQ
jgi:protein SCO1/2